MGIGVSNGKFKKHDNNDKYKKNEDIIRRCKESSKKNVRKFKNMLKIGFENGMDKWINTVNTGIRHR